MKNTVVHYFIRLETPLPAQVWFEKIAEFKIHMKWHKMILDEFGDPDDFERETIRRAGQRDYCEGYILNPTTNWQRVLEQALAEIWY
jgi:hypothetical protein